MSHNVIDLFCGCGGFSLGFHQAGFRICLGVDSWSDATVTYAKNFPDAVTLNEDITKITEIEILEALNKSIDEIDVIIGGPPCQGFSVSGKRSEDDPRNELYKSFVRIVDFIKPKIFVLENVPGLARLWGGKVLENVIADFSSIGFDVKHEILSADCYGIPQQRRRVFFVGINQSKVRKTKGFTFPLRTHGNGTNADLLTCKFLRSAPRSS